MALTLLIGGARSGKSSFAVDIGHRHHAAGFDVTYIATATALDDDMADRIDRHRAERPSGWSTVEETTDLIGAIERVPNGLVIIDCLTLWTSNLMWQDLSDEAISQAARDAAACVAGRDDPSVVISNEVGLGIHPDTDLGRRYRDVLGRVNQIWAAVADPTMLMVAGRATLLDDPWELLG